jgi:hypothetical protein
MNRHTFTATLVVLLCGAGVARAQEPAKSQPAAPATTLKPAVATVTALMVDVTLSRYLGDKRLSSTPYTVSVIPGQRSSLRMGGDVPVPSTTFTPLPKEGDKPATPIVSFSYRSIGTNLDVESSAGVDGQYRIQLTIEDNSIYPPELAPPTTRTTGAPAFRRFSSSNTIALRDGQSLDYTMATDRLTGEVYRVTVKLTVVK